MAVNGEGRNENPADCTNYAIEVKADGYITSTRQVTLVEDATLQLIWNVSLISTVAVM